MSATIRENLLVTMGMYAGEMDQAMEIDLPFLRSMMGNDWKIYKQKVAEHMGKDFPIDEYMRLLNEGIDYTIENVPIPMRPGAMEVLNYGKENGYEEKEAILHHLKTLDDRQ